MSAYGIRAVTNSDGFDILQRFRNLLLRERTDHIRRDRSGSDTLLAQLIHHILDNFRCRVHQEDRHIGVVHPVLLYHRIVATSQLSEFLGDFFEYFTGIVHGHRLLVAVIDIIRFIHVWADCNRVVAVKRVRKAGRRLLPHEFVDILTVRERLHTALLVGSEIAVRSYHNRQADLGMLSQLQCHQIHVVDGLRVTAHQNRPAGIECKIQIGVVTVNVQRSRNGTADQIHDHRHARTCLYRQLLQHEHVTLRAGRVEHASAGCRSAVADPCRAVLTVRRHEHNIMLSACFHSIEELGNLCRRRDREVSHDMIVDLMGRIGCHLIA
ncbi:hypothetical protein D3C73_1006830 [compost metagenome]